MTVPARPAARTWRPAACLKIESTTLSRTLSPGPIRMPLFWKPYKSDVTSFIEDLKAKRPTLEAEQRQGRALLWDKRVDFEARAAAAEMRVPQQPYVYQTKTN